MVTHTLKPLQSHECATSPMCHTATSVRVAGALGISKKSVMVPLRICRQPTTDPKLCEFGYHTDQQTTGRRNPLPCMHTTNSLASIMQPQGLQKQAFESLRADLCKPKQTTCAHTQLFPHPQASVPNTMTTACMPAVHTAGKGPLGKQGAQGR